MSAPDEFASYLLDREEEVETLKERLDGLEETLCMLLVGREVELRSATLRGVQHRPYRGTVTLADGLVGRSLVVSSVHGEVRANASQIVGIAPIKEAE